MNVLRAKATSLSFDAISRPENRKACRTALLWVELLFNAVLMLVDWSVGFARRSTQGGFGSCRIFFTIRFTRRLPITTHESLVTLSIILTLRATNSAKLITRERLHA